MIVGQLLAKLPERFLTAGFGGSGLAEVEAWRDKVPPDKEGRDPQETEASRVLRIRRAMDLGMSREKPRSRRRRHGRPRRPSRRPDPQDRRSI
jgi:hypothetical protein